MHLLMGIRVARSLGTFNIHFVSLILQLAVDSPDNRLELREDKCYATPTQDPDDNMKYDIIRQR